MGMWGRTGDLPVSAVVFLPCGPARACPAGVYAVLRARSICAGIFPGRLGPGDLWAFFYLSVDQSGCLGGGSGLDIVGAELYVPKSAPVKTGALLHDNIRCAPTGGRRSEQETVFKFQ